MTTTSATEEGEKCIEEIWKFHRKNLPRPIGRERYEQRENDVIVNAFVKSGSSLLLQMIYQIVVQAGGSSAEDPTGEKFEDQNQVTPWLEFAPLFPNRIGETRPRIFKTHTPLFEFQPLCCRHIVLLRNPLDIPASFLDYLFDALVTDGEKKSDHVKEAAFHVFAEQSLRQAIDTNVLLPPNWHAFALASTAAPARNVLMLFYEHVIADMKGTIRTIADFLRADLSDDALATVLQRCDRDYMINSGKFDGTYEANLFNISTPVTKVKPKRDSGFKRFKISDDLVEIVENNNLMAFGVKTYEEYMNLISEQQARLGRKV